MTERRSEMEDLLIRRATEGLDPESTVRLNGLLAEFPDLDSEWADRLVGELDAESVVDEEIPLTPELREALLEAAAGDMAEGSETKVVTVVRIPATAWIGWAAAAALAFLWFGAQGGSGPGSQAGAQSGAGGDTGAGVAVPSSYGFDQVAALDDAVRLEWAPGGDETGSAVTGEVVWSDEAQTGVMRFRGLLANAARDFQYQLWIFDAAREERYPVDGGVFDIPEGADQVEIPIRAKLAVSEATLFAVTVEEPGGVVVSSRERIATLAQVGA